jgi:hypothetical protein
VAAITTGAPPAGDPSPRMRSAAPARPTCAPVAEQAFKCAVRCVRRDVRHLQSCCTGASIAGVYRGATHMTKLLCACDTVLSRAAGNLSAAGFATGVAARRRLFIPLSPSDPRASAMQLPGARPGARRWQRGV